MISMGQFIRGYQEVRAKARRRALHEAPRFNIFQLLGPVVTRSEVTTHSALLASLLDPGGTHGQDSLFLRTFFDYCVDKFDEFPIPEPDTGHWEVQTEVFSHLGRLDVVVRNPAIGYLCLIENKIDALEQPDQLRRYREWMGHRKHEYPFQALVYLTLSGYAAFTADDQPYFQLSYREDVAGWLDTCLPEIQAPAVREVVKQYRDLVKVLDWSGYGR